MNQLFKGSITLTKFNFKRNKYQILVWLICLISLSISVAVSYADVYSEPSSRELMVPTLKNPAIIALIGTTEGMNNYSIGAMFGHQMTLLMAICVAIMNILLVAKNTRGEEEYGRHEMIRSLATGKISTIFATYIEMLVINFFISISSGIGIALLNIESMDVNASLLYGFSLGITGFVFGSLTAFIAQLVSSKRTTVGIAFILLGLSYLLRACTDIYADKFSWLSPLSWSYKTSPFVNNNWTPLSFGILFSTVLILSSSLLYSRRDYGSSIIVEPSGRKKASKFLLTPYGLPFNLLKTTILGWLISLFILGATFGSFFGDIESFIDSSTMQFFISEYTNYSLAEELLSLLAGLFAIVSCIPTLIVLFKLMSEESLGKIELIVAKSVSRNTLLFTYFSISFVVGILSVLLSMSGLYVTSRLAMSNPLNFSQVMLTGIVYLPVLWLFIGLAILFIGILPKSRMLIWLFIGFSFFLEYFGTMLDVPNWIQSLSPFFHIPKLPVDKLTFSSILIMIVLGIGFMVIGNLGYRRRDILAK